MDKGRGLASQFKERFFEDGFILIKGALCSDRLATLKKLLSQVADGDLVSGLAPDKIKFQFASNDTNSTRLIHSVCNAWKSNPAILEIFVQTGVAEVARELMRWDGVKLNQDTFFRVAPQCGPTSFHRDNDYQDWNDSIGGIVTSWLALEDVVATSGGISYFQGSHKLKAKVGRLEGKFVGEGDPFGEIVNRVGDELLSYPLVTPTLRAGDLLLHHGDILHGARLNESSSARLAYSCHMMASTARFTSNNNPVFSRYKLDGTFDMDQSFFPVIA